MKTSNFKSYKGKDGIAICLFPPLNWVGPSFIKLAPDKDTFFKKKTNQITEKEYEQRYKTNTLSKLDPQNIYDELKDKVLLCYEEPIEFCHRFLVAKWIKEELNIEVSEWKPSDEIKNNINPLF